MSSISCMSREKKFKNINNLIAEIRKVKRIEKYIALTIALTRIALTQRKQLPLQGSGTY